LSLVENVAVSELGVFIAKPCLFSGPRKNASLNSSSQLAFPKEARALPEMPITPRKTPRQARSAETVRAILEAAARILEARGFDGYNTNAVAELAGVSVGSLYQYFPGKDALTAALIEREKAQLLRDVAAIEITDPRTALREVIAACAAHQMRRPVLARLLDFEELRLPLREQQADAADRLTTMLGSIMRLVPGLSPDRLETTAADCLAIIKGINDASGERGETDMTYLRYRVERAVFGYLGMLGPVDP